MKNQTKFYHKWWFWVIVGFLILAFITTIMDEDCSQANEKIESLCELNNGCIEATNSCIDLIKVINPSSNLEKIAHLNCQESEV